VSTSASAYAVGQPVVVSFANLAGYNGDWIAIAQDGTPNTSYLRYAYTGGAVTGSVSFEGLSGGSYRARAFRNNGHVLQSESAVFTVASAGAPTLSSDAASYAPGATVVASFTGLAGYPQDWIAIAQDGSPLSSHVRFVYTNGQTGGSVSFSGLSGGTYRLRAFVNGGYTLQAESAAFTITQASPPAVTTERSSYVAGETVTVSYAGLIGYSADWIAIAEDGAPPTSFIRFVYTNGATSGSTTFAGLTNGTYRARAFLDGGYTVQAESAAFTISSGGAASVTTNASTYQAGVPVIVSFANLTGYSTDWIAIAEDGAPLTSFVQWRYTEGATSGNRVFTGLAGRTYRARAFANNSYTLQAESAPFTVEAGGAPTVTTDATSHPHGTPVVVSYSGLIGYSNDWIALARDGSPLTSYVAFSYTAGGQQGATTFTSVAAGTYRIRAFAAGGYDLQAESDPFVVNHIPSTIVTDKGSYRVGEDVIVSYRDLNYPDDRVVIALEGSSPSETVMEGTVTSTTAGALSFQDLLPGSYSARVLRADGTIEVESVTFLIRSAVVEGYWPAYANETPLIIEFDGMPGRPDDQIAIALQGAAPDVYAQLAYTGGQLRGRLAFYGLAPGAYQPRALMSDERLPVGEGRPLTLGAAHVVPHEYLIALTEDDPDFANKAAAIIQAYNLSNVELLDSLGIIQATVPAAEVLRVIEDPHVTMVGQDKFLEVQESASICLPDSTALNASQLANTALRRVGGSVNGLHQTLPVKGDGIGIAVIDSGVAQHDDLAPLGEGFSIFGSAKPYNQSDTGHGTAVAGVIAALDDEKGIVGLAPRVKIHPIRIMIDEDTEPAKLSQMLRVIKWIRDNQGRLNIKVVTQSVVYRLDPVHLVSQSTSTCDNREHEPAQKELCKLIKNKNITWVSAVTNDGTALGAYYTDGRIGNALWPSVLNEVVTVASFADADGQPGGMATLTEPFAACPTESEEKDDGYYRLNGAHQNDKIDIAAPGTCVRLLDRSPDQHGDLHHGYCLGSGASFAAPMVAAAAALYLQNHPNASSQAVRDYLSTVAEPNPAMPNPGSHLHRHESLLRVSKPRYYAMGAISYGATDAGMMAAQNVDELTAGVSVTYPPALPLGPWFYGGTFPSSIKYTDGATSPDGSRVFFHMNPGNYDDCSGINCDRSISLFVVSASDDTVERVGLPLAERYRTSTLAFSPRRNDELYMVDYTIEPVGQTVSVHRLAAEFG